MPKLAIALNEIEIVAYADVLPADSGPKTLPPVFRWQRNGEVLYCMPPFDILRTEVIDPVVVDEHEYRELIKREQLTVLPAPTPAKENHVLWRNDNQETLYIPHPEYLKLKQTAYGRWLTKAERLLEKFEVEEAERNALIAFAADDSKLEPIALLAAICVVCGEEETVLATHRALALDTGYRQEDFERECGRYVEMAYYTSPADVDPVVMDEVVPCIKKDIRFGSSMEGDENQNERTAFNVMYAASDADLRDVKLRPETIEQIDAFKRQAKSERSAA